MFKKIYRRFFYSTFKRLERLLRVGFFFLIKKIYPNFNTFRVFGLPAGWRSVSSQTVISVSSFLHKPPHTLESVSHPNFEKFEQEGREQKVALLSGGIQTEAASAITSDGYLVREFTQQFTMHGEHSHKLFTFRKERCFASIPHFEGTVASLVADCHMNYYHWLFDVLPKIFLFQKAGLSISKYYAQSSLGFQRDSLRLLGVENVIPVQDNPIISASSLALATFPAQKGISKWICDYLRGCFPPGKAKKRLFISRRDASFRRIINEEECGLILERFGFETVVPGKLTFEEQIATFREAEIILAPHGAGLSNIVFAPSSAKVIEIYSSRSTCVCFWHLANLLGMSYSYFRGMDDSSTFASTHPAHDHIRVDPQKLEQAIELAIQDQHPSLVT